MSNQKSRTHFAALNISTNLVGFVLTTLLGFVCRIVFVKYLTADYLGLNGLFTNIISMLSLAELGIGGAITFALYDPIAKNDRNRIAVLITYFAKIYQWIGVTVAVLGVALIPFLHLMYKEPPKISESVTFIYVLFLFGTAISYFFSHKVSLLRASQKDYIVVGLSYVVSIVQNILQIVALVLTKDYLIYLYIQVAAGLFYFIWISWVYRKQYGWLKEIRVNELAKNERKSIFKNVWALTAQRLGGVLVNSTDNIIISYLVNVAAVGMLSNYLLFTKMFEGLLANLLYANTAGIGNFNSLESKENTRKLFLNVQFFLFVVYGWITVGILVLSNDVVEFLFGKNYVMGFSIPLILAVNFYMVGMQTVLWTFRNALGLFNFRKYLLLVTAAINLVLSFWLGKLYGVFGVLFATFIARLLTNWWYDPVVVFKYGFGGTVKSYFLTYAKYLLFTVLACVLTWYICKYIAFALILNIVLKTLVATFIFFIIIYLIFRKSEEFSYAHEKLSAVTELVMASVGKIINKKN